MTTVNITFNLQLTPSKFTPDTLQAYKSLKAHDPFVSVNKVARKQIACRLYENVGVIYEPWSYGREDSRYVAGVVGNVPAFTHVLRSSNTTGNA